MTRRWRFALPRHVRGHPMWTIGSVVLHLVIGVALLIWSGPTLTRVVTFVDLGGGPEVREVPLPPVGGAPAAPAGGASRDLTPREVAIVPPVDSEPPAPDRGIVAAVGRGGDSVVAAEETPAGTGLDVGPGRRILGPRLGDGRLWIRPREAILAAIAEALGADPSLDGATHLERLDSAVTARILAFVDTLAQDSLDAPRPPSWTTEIAGETWGIDEQWIYLGGLKLPSMILALLPIPQGNYDQAQQAAELARIRQDIIRAAQRAQDMAQFRRYVEETRQRRDAERERARNRGVTPRDSVKT